MFLSIDDVEDHTLRSDLKGHSQDQEILAILCTNEEYPLGSDLIDLGPYGDWDHVLLVMR